MKITTVIMILGSLGFIVMGLISLLSKGIRNYFKESGIYNDVDAFMKYSSIFNLAIGVIGILLGGLDHFLNESSRVIVIVYVLVIFILSIIQRSILKKYKNF